MSSSLPPVSPRPASRAMDVRDQSHVAEVRRAAVAAAVELGASRASEAGIVATELATNLLKHAGEGAIIVQVDHEGGLELLAIDRGPGFANLEIAMRDGFSTAGSPGTGLGAVARFSNVMEVYSQLGRGTVIYAVVGAGPGRSGAAATSSPRPPPPPAPRAGLLAVGLSVALRGESVCGDGYAAHGGAQGFFMLVADGLGHGPMAAEASQAALEIFAKRTGEPPGAVVSDIHDALRATRGAAVALAHVHPHLGTVRYCGVGNIVGAVVSDDGMRRMISHNGTAGLGSPRMSEFTYPWTPNSMLIMHSDGLGTKWDLEQYPGLVRRHPALVAGVLLRDFSRERDDATVVVAREAAA